MANRKSFPDSVVPLPEDGHNPAMGLIVQAATPPDLSDPLTVHFAFAMPKGAEADLEAKVAAGQVVSPAEQAARYAAAPAEVDALKGWLTQQGFDIVETTPDGIYARAPAAQVGKSLQVDFARVTRDGFTYNAARNVPSLPADLSANVSAIGGLQPFLRAHRHGRMRTPKAGNRADMGDTAEGMAPQAGALSNAPPYLVAEIMKAYDAAGLPVTGAGQTIAILIDRFPDDADLQAFWTANAIPGDVSRIEKINVKQAPLAPPEGEETLDASWTSGIAAGARIRIYASGSLAFVDLDRALDQILADAGDDPGLRQLSVSLGLGEVFLGGPGGEVATQHRKFLKLAAAGVNVFVSSGDAGSRPDQSGHGSGGPVQAEFSASDPFVIGVGGTSLVLSAGGGVASETGWANGGGGESRFFARPTYQTAKGMPPGTKRIVPDVSATADPEFGAFLILNGTAVQFGGTSWSAPIWAGFCALINEARQRAGMAALPFLGPLLYPLAGTDAFRDITKGNNGDFDAVAGFDLVTGLGVPNVGALIERLTSPPIA